MKAVLVIDTSKCGGCPFCHKNDYYSWCDAPRKERSWEMPLTSKDIEEERTVECPLRPLPQKKEVDEQSLDLMWWSGEHDMAYDVGYNACLKEITGEEEKK